MHAHQDDLLELGQSVLRLQYDPGFEGFDHSWGGFLTDYMLFALCTYCLISAARWPGPPLGYIANISGRAIHMGFVFSQGLCFLCGGVAHNLMDIWFKKGQVMGREWSAENSSWMYLWLVAIAMSPMASAFSCMLVWEIQIHPGLVVHCVLLALGLIVSIAEIVIMVKSDVSSSGLYSAYLALLLGLVSCIMSMIPVNLPLLRASLIGSVGWLIVTFKPESCTKVGKEREGCPFPEKFNQNVVFHVFLMAWVFLLHVEAHDLNMASILSKEESVDAEIADSKAEQEHSAIDAQ